MSKEIIYIDYDEALNIYGKMIDASDGGFEGVRDEGGIRATLDFVQNDLYYPTFADKLTYLMYRFCSGHFFNGKQLTTIFFKSFTDGCTHSVFKRRDNQ